MSKGETYTEDRQAFLEAVTNILAGKKPYEGIALNDLKKEEKNITKTLAKKHYKSHGGCVQSTSVVKCYEDKQGFYLHTVCLFEDGFIDTMNCAC